MALLGLGGNKKACCICGEKHKDDGLDCFRLNCGEYVCNKHFSFFLGADGNVKQLKEVQFNSEIQASLRSKFKKTERYGGLYIDKKNGLFSFAVEIGSGNPILPISSIIDMEIQEGTKETRYIFQTAYEEWPVNNFAMLSSVSHYKNLMPWEIRNEKNINGIKTFYELSQKLRKDAIESGKDPAPDVFKGSFCKDLASFIANNQTLFD